MNLSPDAKKYFVFLLVPTSHHAAILQNLSRGIGETE